MATAHPEPLLEANRLLAALSPADHECLLPAMEVVMLAMKQLLHQEDQPIEHVYFPRNAVISLVSALESGPTVEVATVGNEGMAGLPVFLGAGVSPIRAIAQVPGAAVRIEAGAFCEELGRNGALHRLLHRYTQAMFDQLAQNVICNRAHRVEQRCARWLLMTHDRVGSDDFPMTQEFLAQMLGVRRATVTVVSRALHQAGLIRYQRGRMTILDRPGLEAAACECYRIIRDAIRRLLG